jgi:hypothetical protein
MNRSLYVLTVLLLACATFAAPAPDPFKSGWGNPIDLDRDCKISRNGSTLTIEMPGSEHGYDPIRERFNAPRLLREIEGDFDMQVRARIDCRPAARSTVKGLPSCASAGFLLIYPDTSRTTRTTCIRLEYGLSQPGIGLDGYAVKPRLPKPRSENASGTGIGEDGYAAFKHFYCKVQPSTMTWDHGLQEEFHFICDRGWKNWPFPEKTDYAYLRLEQRDKWITFFISPDGEKWSELTYQPSLPAKANVGLAAYSTSTERSKVCFDQLRVKRGKKKER